MRAANDAVAALALAMPFSCNTEYFARIDGTTHVSVAIDTIAFFGEPDLYGKSHAEFEADLFAAVSGNVAVTAYEFSF